MKRAATAPSTFCVFAHFACVLALCASGCRAKRELVYVSAEDGGEVVVADAERAVVVTRIPVGKRPRGIRLSPDGKFLYVALSGSPRGGPQVDESKLPPPDRTADGIGVVDVGKNELVRTLPSGTDPESFDVSLDGKTLYVSNEETAELSVLDIDSGKITKKIPVGKEPEGVTLRPDGRALYVTSEQDDAVFVVDTQTLAVGARIPTGKRPRAVVFARDGSAAFVTNEVGGSITVVDAKANTPVGTIAIESTPETPQRPMGAVLSPDGRTLYVSTGRGGSIAVIDVAGRRVSRRIDGVGARPWGIGVSNDGRYLFTANGPSGDLSVVEVSSGRVDKRVAIGALPWGVAVVRR
jgi:YVTN family beta-propeller protein